MIKMKIGLVSPYDIFKGGGVQELILALQKGLALKGHEVKILTPHPRHYKGDVPENVIFVGVSTDVKSPLNTTVQISSASGEKMADMLENEDFDVLNFHEPWVPMIGRQILSRSNAINVATFHAKLPDTKVSKTLEKVVVPYTKSILKYFDAYTAVSDAASEYLMKLTDEPVNIVPNGIDLSKYKPKPASKTKTPTIFYVGRLEKRKGIKYLLKAFGELQNRIPEAKLVVGGDGPDRQMLEDYASDLGLSNVNFLGYVSEEDKISYLQSSTVFCSPALHGESFGIVLLEALACGTAIIAGDNPGYASVMQGRGELSVVNPKHTTDFARRLHILLTDSEIRGSLTKWGTEYVSRFDYPVIVDQYDKLFTDLRKERKESNA